MIRAIGLMRGDPLQFLTRAWQAHGDVVQFPIPRPPTYLVTEPSAVRDILVGRIGSFNKQTIQYKSLSLVTGTGLLTSDDPPWRERRRVLQPTFHHEAIGAIAGHMTAAIEQCCEQWQTLPPGSVVDVDRAMTELSLRASAAALFGIEVGSGADMLGKASVAALDAVVARARNPFGAVLPPSRRMKRSADQLDAFVDKVIAARLAEPGHANRTPDIVDVLLQAQNDPTNGIDADAVRDEMVTALVAGHETVASALTWVWYLLGQHPEVAHRLRHEVDSQADDSLPLTRAIVHETLRLYPPAWVITRRSEAHTAMGRFEIPAQSLLIMSPWLIHRHPRIWSNPEAFDPDRFLSESEQRVGYLPFGVGPRQCIGRDMALLECVIAIAQLTRRCSFEALDDLQPKVLASVTARPADGLRMKLVWR